MFGFVKRFSNFNSNLSYNINYRFYLNKKYFDRSKNNILKEKIDSKYYKIWFQEYITTLPKPSLLPIYNKLKERKLNYNPELKKVSYTTYLKRYIETKNENDIQLLINSLNNGPYEINENIYLLLAQYYYKIKNINQLEDIPNQMKEKHIPIQNDIYFYIIKYYCDHNQISNIKNTLQIMKDNNISLDTSIYNLLLSFYISNNDNEKINSFSQMLFNITTIKPNYYTFNMLFKYYLELNDNKTCLLLINIMNDNNIQYNALSYYLLIYYYIQNDNKEEINKIIQILINKQYIFNTNVLQKLIDYGINNNYNDIIDNICNNINLNYRPSIEIYNKLLQYYSNIHNSMDNNKEEDIKDNNKDKRKDMINYLTNRIIYFNINLNITSIKILANYYKNTKQNKFFDNILNVMKELNIETDKELYDILSKHYTSNRDITNIKQLKQLFIQFLKKKKN